MGAWSWLSPFMWYSNYSGSLKEQVNEIYCRGGKYNIEFFEKHHNSKRKIFPDMNPKFVIIYVIMIAEDLLKEKGIRSDKWERR